jgi:hypothetical protein
VEIQAISALARLRHGARPRWPADQLDQAEHEDQRDGEPATAEADRKIADALDRRIAGSGKAADPGPASLTPTCLADRYLITPAG